MSKIYCNECESEFNLKPLVQKLPLGIERIYLRCPECKHEYTAYYTNKLIRQKQKNIRRLALHIKTLKRESAIKEATAKFEKLSDELGEMIEALKIEIEKSK